MFPASQLEIVARAEDIPGIRERLHIGDRVRLNGGGPLLLVVDLADNNVTAAWRDGSVVTEATFNRRCLSYVAPFSS